MIERETLEFESLPLIEVALKRFIVPNLPISLPFVVRLVKDLEARFKQVYDLPGIEQVPGRVQRESYEVHTTKGCRLFDSESGVMVTVQRDLLVARWSRTGADPGTEGQGEVPYPRFPALQEALDSVEAAIRGLGIAEFRPSLVNLAYANRVSAVSHGGSTKPLPWPIAEPWTPGALMVTGQSGEMRELQTCHRAGDGIERRLFLAYREDEQPPSSWFLLLTVAGKPVSEGEEPSVVEQTVHDALIHWFPQLLSDDAKAQYGLNK